MKVKVVLAGKVKDINYQEILREYVKRIKGFVDFEFIDLRIAEDAPLSEKGSLKLLDMGKDSYKIVLDVDGESFTSESFAYFLDETLNNKKNVIFYIGGAFGLGKEFVQKCNKSISLSKMTMAHKIALVVLMEQIYRAFTILGGHPYHK